MGIEIAESLITQNHYCPEQRLWRHVLLNAVEDTRITQSDRKSSICKISYKTNKIKDINLYCNFKIVI